MSARLPAYQSMSWHGARRDIGTFGDKNWLGTVVCRERIETDITSVIIGYKETVGNGTF